MKVSQRPSGAEAIETFECFGDECTVLVRGAGPAGTPQQAVQRAKRRLLGWHEQFSRFDPDSELSRVNEDRGEVVSVSPVMARFVEAGLSAAARTGGLVDPTLVAEVERAGYARDLDVEPLALKAALELAPPRAGAGPSRHGRWREVRVDRKTGTVIRPPGVRLDSGGIVKGLFGDLLATVLGGHESFAVDAAGDLRLGGTAALARPVRVASPFGGPVLHVFDLVSGAAATSGIGKRSWLDREGRPAHHLLDPGSGKPAFTGIVQVTALAPSAVAAESLAKAALLSGPQHAQDWLPHGGLVVYDCGAFDVLCPAGAHHVSRSLTYCVAA